MPDNEGMRYLMPAQNWVIAPQIRWYPGCLPTQVHHHYEDHGTRDVALYSVEVASMREEDRYWRRKLFLQV